ncbi:hypothetical protein NMG60_11004357 [Bertholletia excelsa]
MTMEKKGGSKTSVCQKMMKMLGNVLKLSCLSAARMGRRPTENPPVTQGLTSLTGSAKVAADPPLSQFSGSQIEQVASCVIHEEYCVDKRASEYIRRVREKNLSHSREASMFSSLLPPPPPPPPRVFV